MHQKTKGTNRRIQLTEGLPMIQVIVKGDHQGVALAAAIIGGIIEVL